MADAESRLPHRTCLMRRLIWFHHIKSVTKRKVCPEFLLPAWVQFRWQITGAVRSGLDLPLLQTAPVS